MLQITGSWKNSPSSIDIAKRNKVGTICGGDNCEDEIVKKSPSKNLNGATGYLIPEARFAFTKLRKTFTKALIIQYFDLECHMRIETDASGYPIGRVLS